MSNQTMETTDAGCVGALPSNFVDEFQVASPFQNTQQMEFFHQTFLRYGYSTNILHLMEGTQSKQQDYMKSVLAASITLLVVVVIWMVLLIVFRAMGPYRVGILSGKHKQIRKGVTVDKEYEQYYTKARKRLRFYRIIVVFCSLSIVISSILMSINGIDSLTSSLQEGREGISIVTNLTKEGIEIIDLALSQNEETGIVVERLLEDLNGICPNVRDPLCTDLNDLTTCNFDGIFDTQTLENVVSHFRGGGTGEGSDQSQLYADLAKVRNDLEGFLTITAQIDEQASEFNWALYLTMVFNLCLAAMSILIIICICMGTPKFVRCLRSWILIPTFSLFVILSFVFCFTFLMGTMVVADMCVDSPDTRIQTILNRFQDELSPILVEFATFYINQCPIGQLPTEISDQVTYFRDGVALVSDFTAMISATTSDGVTGGAIQSICGFDDPGKVSALAETTNSNLCDVISVMETIRQYFQCRNWYPLYETIVYDAICYDGMEGFTWVVSTQFVVVVMALIILTLRGAFYDLDIAEASCDNDVNQVALPPAVTISPSEEEGFELSASQK